MYATAGFVRGSSSNDYVLLGGGGHAAISSLSVSSATTCSYPAGFTSRNSSNNWPSISGFSLLTAWNHENGEIAFVSNSSG